MIRSFPDLVPPQNPRAPTYAAELQGAGNAWWVRGHDGWPGGVPRGWVECRTFATRIEGVFHLDQRGEFPVTILSKQAAEQRRTA